MALRPFRFGVQATGAADARSWVDLARKVEDLGYATLTMPDHFGDQLAPVPALMAAAASTSTLRIGTLVLDNDYKHPVVLAKELATMDVLSDGRLEIGIGAGWMRSDYDAAGIPYDRPGVRIDRFVEGITVIKGVMAGGEFSFAGDHYTVTAYDGRPEPVQRPHPPVLIGGGGPRMLRIAVEHADIVGINGSLHEGEVGPEAIASMIRPAVDEKIALVKSAAGDRLDDIELTVRAFFVSVTNDRDGAVDGVARLIGVEPWMVADSPFTAIGTTSSITEDLIRQREGLGLSYVVVGTEDIEPFAPVVAALTGR